MEAFFESYWGGILTGALVPIILGLFGNHAYHWLFRNPRIIARVRIQGIQAHSLRGRDRDFDYKITINIENHSSNDAYDFMISDLELAEERARNLTPPSKNGVLVTKNENMKFEYSFRITLPQNKENFGDNAEKRLKDINKEISFKISYKNESNRKFKRSNKIIVETEEDNFIVL